MGTLLQGKAPGPGREYVPSGDGPSLRAVPGVARAGGDSDVVDRRGALRRVVRARALCALLAWDVPGGRGGAAGGSGHLTKVPSPHPAYFYLRVAGPLINPAGALRGLGLYRASQ